MVPIIKSRAISSGVVSSRPWAITVVKSQAMPVAAGAMTAMAIHVISRTFDMPILSRDGQRGCALCLDDKSQDAVSGSSFGARRMFFVGRV